MSKISTIMLETASNTSLLQALGLDASGAPPQAALTGSGGKTTLLFALARALSARFESVWLAGSAHFGLEQVRQADAHHVLDSAADLDQPLAPGIIIFTGRQAGERWQGLDMPVLAALHDRSAARGIPLLVEADGSRQRPLKAHAAWEPPVPAWASLVVVVAGLSALGRPLDEESVHRPELFAGVVRQRPGTALRLASLRSILLDEQVGALKNVPRSARRVVVLNQADTPTLRYRASRLVPNLLQSYERVIVTDLQQAAPARLEVYRPLAGVLLAAGGSQRFGQPKQLLPLGGRPLLLWALQAARRAGLYPLRVVTGAHTAQVEELLAGWPVEVVHNPGWQDGQSSSLRRGLSGLPPEVGGVVFLQADQPFVSAALLHALRRAHASGRGPVIMPSVGGQRTSPVLWDRSLFAELAALSGDLGGRALFSRWPPALLPWRDARLLLDIDTLEDYRRACEAAGSGGGA